MADWGGGDRRPLVSVVCNTYNHRGLIEDALRGFLLQRTSFPFEVIVHDDASTDGTSDVVRDYATRYPRIIRHLLQPENQFSRGRKPTAISSTFATGDYLAFCEGDDFWVDPRKLQAQVEFLGANPGFSACSTWSFVLEGDAVERPERPGRAIVSHVDLLLGSKEHCRMGSLMVRRAALPRDLPEEMNQANAGDNFLRVIATRHGPLGVLPGFYSCYRIHSGGVWSQLQAVERKRKVIHDLHLLRKLVDPRFHAYIDCRIAWTELAGLRGQPLGRSVSPIGTLWRHPLVSLQLAGRQGRRLSVKLLERLPFRPAGRETGAAGWR